MGKLQEILSRLTLAFIAILLLILLIPVLFKEMPFNEVVDKYKGYIWFFGFLGMAGTAILTRIKIVYISELKKTQDVSNKLMDNLEEEKSKVNFFQEKMLKQGDQHLTQLKELNKSMQINVEHNSRTMTAIDSVKTLMKKFDDRIKNIEEVVSDHEIRLRKIKK